MPRAKFMLGKSSKLLELVQKDRKKEEARLDYWKDVDIDLSLYTVGQLLKQFDIHVFCINLEERKDRRERMKHFFEKVLAIPCEQINMLTTRRHPVSGALGCALSHSVCWEQAMKHYPDRPIVVFEDDITTRNKTLFFKNYSSHPDSPEQAIKIFKRYLYFASQSDHLDQWDLLMADYDLMPHYHHDPAKEIAPNFFRVTALSGGCYVANPLFLPRVLDKLRKLPGVPVDVHFATLARQVAHFPVPFMQVDERSDIDPFHASNMRARCQKYVYPLVWYLQKNPTTIMLVITTLVALGLLIAAWSHPKAVLNGQGIRPPATLRSLLSL